MPSFKTLLSILTIIYFGGYLLLRISYAEVWEKDGQTYVIFPENHPELFFIYRQVTYMDGVFTKMRFRLGPHEKLF